MKTVVKRAVLTVRHSLKFPGMLTLRAQSNPESGLALREALARGGFQPGDVVELRMLPKPRKARL